MAKRKISLKQPLTDSAQMRELKKRGVTFDDNNLVELTEANSVIIEQLIPNGIPGVSKKYSPTSPEYQYDVANKTVPAAVRNWVRIIDKENGTNDFRHHFAACNYFTNWILDPNNDFYTRLDSASEDVLKQLVLDMLDDFTRQTNGYKAASLASKVCKYLHERLYGHDRFYINDSVVRSILPFYLRKYGLGVLPANCGYDVLFDSLKKVHNTVCPTLTKTEFDHLLWFTYKSYARV